MIGLIQNMAHLDLMKNPFYAGIMFEIERKIAEGDRLARARGFVLTDSQVISLLTKVAGAAEGKPVKTGEASSARDQFLAELRQQLAAVRDTLSVHGEAADGSPTESALPAADWLAALKCVLESTRLRKAATPGSRDYLDFLVTFVKNPARG